MFLKRWTKYGAALDKVSREISKQNFKIERSLGYLRRIDEDFDDIKFSSRTTKRNLSRSIR